MSNQPIYERISSRERALITFIVMAGAFMAVLDTTIVDIIVPKITGPLSTDLYGVQWVITAYMIASATMLLLADWLDKNFGLKKIYIIGVALFTVSSFACGVANSLESMIAARVFQGIGEALIMATSQTILFAVYPPDKKGIAMGIFGLGVSFAPSIGPTLGGYISEYISWRWVFFINVPVGILTILLSIFYLPETSTARQKTRLNFVSFFFLSVFTITTLIILSKGQQLGWFNSDFIVYMGIIAVYSLLFYILSEMLSKEPLIDFRIFKIKEYFVGVSIYFLLLGFSMYQLFYLLPIYFEKVKGYTTLDAGIHILAFAVFIALFSPLAGILSDKIGEKYVLYISAVIYLISSLFLLPKLDYFTPGFKAALMTVPLGISLGMFFAPVSTLALRKLGDKTSLGTGLLHYSRFIGGSFGTAIATNDLYKYTYQHFDGITITQNYSYVELFLQKLKTIFTYLEPSKAAFLAKAVVYKVQNLYAFNWAVQDTFFVAGLFGLIGASPLLILLIDDVKLFFKAFLNSGSVRD